MAGIWAAINSPQLTWGHTGQATLKRIAGLQEEPARWAAWCGEPVQTRAMPHAHWEADLAQTSPAPPQSLNDQGAVVLNEQGVSGSLVHGELRDRCRVETPASLLQHQHHEDCDPGASTVPGAASYNHHSPVSVQFETKASVTQGEV